MLGLRRSQPLLEVLASTKSGSISVHSKAIDQATTQHHLTCRVAHRASAATPVKAAALGAVHGACRALCWLVRHKSTSQDQQAHMLGMVEPRQEMELSGMQLLHEHTLLQAGTSCSFQGSRSSTAPSCRVLSHFPRVC